MAHIKDMIAEMILEYQNLRNDGWVRDGHEKELLEIRDMIIKAFPPKWVRKLREEEDFPVQSLDPDERTWAYDGNGKRRLKEELD